MALDIRLTQKLTQKLVMTPQLRQAIKILQLPRGELDALINEELAENPVVERTEEEEATPEEPIVAGEEVEPTPAAEEIDWKAYLESYNEDMPALPPTGDSEGDEERQNTLENLLTRTESLAEHLSWQLRFSDLTEEEKQIASLIIGNLDVDGYLQASTKEIAASAGVSVELVERVLQIIQACDPPGVGARDLRECLLIQLEARNTQGTLAWKLVHDQFDSLVNRRFPEIARQLKCSAEDVQAAADVVATLNPKPGFQVSSEDPKYVVPDLIVERVDDQYVVLLNDRHLPRLRISAAYESVLRDKKRAECTDGEAKTREYIQSKLNSARWLIQTIEQRRRTMIKVMNCIIREQREFFDKGIAFLRPLTLQQVARQIDMHESTVSRVCSGKYVQTPRGVFELKFYFSSGLETDDGEDVSARAAKDIIKTLIEEEDRKDPLSDQRIAALLHEKGWRIARRTVAKYREQLRILPARFRRRV